MRKIIASIIMMASALCLLTGCAAKRSLTITLDDSCKDAEAFVTVYDKKGKDMGGGNVMSNGPLMVSVNDGTYTVKVTEITGDGYELPEPAEVTVKGDTQYKIVLTEKIAADVQTGMPNPVVEYSSLEEINEVAGVNLMKPPVMGVSNERFSVIDGRIAQYICDVNGLEWTFRGACITDEDISGIYDERNVFTSNEDSGLYANEFYLDRFFDGDRQYTIVVKDPISEDGDILIDEETYSNCCMEMKSILKQHMDDPLVGDYQNAADERMMLYVERLGDEYSASVNLSVSDSEFKCWTMQDVAVDGDKLTYRGEEIGHYIYDADGNETSSDVTMSNNLGYFEIKDGRLYWTGAAQEECRAIVFEKMVYTYEADTAESSETALPPYVYTGNDPAEKAIIDYFEDNNYLMKPEGSVWIPAFSIIMADAVNPDGEEAKKGDVKIYGNFWSFVYSKQGDTLFCESGGEYPGVIYLWYKGGNEYEVSYFDRVGDGSQYAEDIKRICNGNASLEEQYRNAADSSSAEVKNKRTWSVYKYVKDNNLDIKYYQDYGWDPVDFNMEVNSWGNVILEGYEEPMMIPII